MESARRLQKSARALAYDLSILRGDQGFLVESRGSGLCFNEIKNFGMLSTGGRTIAVFCLGRCKLLIQSKIVVAADSDPLLGVVLSRQERSLS